MSSGERFVRHHKRQTDRAISAAYVRLPAASCARARFAELLGCVRERAPRLLAAPVVDGRHPGVEALVNLACDVSVPVRPLAAWCGCDASWRAAIASLAQHLAAAYPVPRFLARAWYATGPYAERKRTWYLAHGRGAPFRSLDLPIAMTRKMEDILLASPDHLEIESAMRRAELLGLGAGGELVRAVLATSAASDLRNGEFWRTVWMFLIADGGSIPLAQVGPVIDFIQSIRHERVAVETPAGMVMRDPPQPSFSLRGRTARSMLRLMREWHRSLGVANGGLTWAPSPLRPMLIEEPPQDPSAPPIAWHLTELTNGAALRAEGTALHHCVASYADRCWRGTSRIWSLRVRRGDKVRHVLTIEVNPKRRAIVQARGWGNDRPSGKALRLLREWAVRERLRLAM